MKDTIVIIILFVVVIVLAIFSTVPERIEFKTRLENGTSVIAECEVVDKYDRFVGGGATAVRRFYYEVDYILPNGEHHIERIKTSRTFYNSIDVGDAIQCGVAYDDEGVFYLKPLSDFAEEETVYNDSSDLS